MWHALQAIAGAFLAAIGATGVFVYMTWGHYGHPALWSLALVLGIIAYVTAESSRPAG